MNDLAMFGLSNLFGRCKTKGRFHGIISLIFLFLFSFLLASCKPTAVITADPQSGPAPLAVEFDGSGSTDWNRDIVSYEWDFDGDGTIDMEGITATYTYQGPGTYMARLIVTDEKTNTSETTREIRVYGSPTVSIEAAPLSVISGEPTTLSWTSTYADFVSIDQGIGGVGTNGSMIISPTETITYTITATGPGGSATDSVTVTVYTSIPEVNISASPGTISQGGSAILTWASSNASSAFINQGIGEVSLSGSIEVSPLATTTYTIMVTGPLGAASAKTDIMVLGDVEPQPEGSFGEQYEDLIPIDARGKRCQVLTFDISNKDV
ncbi:MAG: PKD domain-containing protein [Thermodesulfobacteriota bacterium]|nr:PKD domain-containing protein [Thermodesulfobacteriota bacterium]